MNKYLTWNEAREIAKKRYLKHKKRTDNLGIQPSTLGDFLTILRTNIFGEDFKCTYCGCELQITSPYPYFKVFSFDHKIPLARGGGTTKDNLCICCTRCNIIKGTLKAETYIKLLNKLKDDEELMNELFINMFEVRLANKIKRVENEVYDADNGVNT